MAGDLGKVELTGAEEVTTRLEALPEAGTTAELGIDNEVDLFISDALEGVDDSRSAEVVFNREALALPSTT